MNEQAMKDVLAQILSCVLSEVAAQSGHSCCASENGPIPVELSARHVHLSEKDAIALFGAPLTHARDLSQPGQFLCKERVRLISKTDARALGVDAPVRQSGDVAGSPGIILASDHGIVGLEEGVIVASRHIHMSPADAARFGVSDNEMVSVRLGTERPVVFEDVLVRVSDKFNLAMHIDADEGNGSGWKKGVDGVIVGKSGCRHGH